jgi:ferritin-like protein
VRTGLCNPVQTFPPDVEPESLGQRTEKSRFPSENPPADAVVRKGGHGLLSIQRIPKTLPFHPLGPREVSDALDSGCIGSDSGALLLRRMERIVEVIRRSAACFVDDLGPRLAPVRMIWYTLVLFSAREGGNLLAPLAPERAAHAYFPGRLEGSSLMSISYHEPAAELSSQTRDVHRALASLIEELEAIDWYNQRVDITGDQDLKEVLIHNRDEEIEHAAMALEWLRRRMPKFDEELRTYLFTSAPIAHAEDEGEAPAAGAARPTGDLGIGKFTKG